MQLCLKNTMHEKLSFAHSAAGGTVKATGIGVAMVTPEVQVMPPGKPFCSFEKKPSFSNPDSCYNFEGYRHESRSS